MVLGWPELGAVETIVEERVREREHGLANLYNDWKVFYTLHPEQQRLHALEGSYWYRYPQGESIPDVRERMRSEMNTLCVDYPGLDIMIVTHHVSILSLVANVQGLDSVAFKKLDRTNKPDNASITTLVPISDGGPTGSMVVESYNQKFYQEAA
ncbi:hypothetical protein EKI60_00350 [Candidatus Saccharibacteria bacterium]|nr:MAG: hypothetical protein EKI60_00350 [Candidatus Saccharibacteria bacterium]TXG77442.1 MAG: hypothetical protein E6P97_01630 [Patescibacteria group bacterium]